MRTERMKIAVIPARGGSKRIPRKNIKEFCGKPIIAWSIGTALQSGLFDKVVVSTDDQEIAQIARKWGAETPFMRPAELSNEFVGTTDVVAHALRWAEQEGLNVEAACCIYATAPFVQIADLKLGWDLLTGGDFMFAFPATEFPAPIFRSFKRLDTGGVEMFFPEEFDTRSQDLPVALHDAGQFYWGRSDAWTKGVRLFGRHSCALVIPRWRVCDIDVPEDWDVAERMYRCFMESR